MSIACLSWVMEHSEAQLGARLTLFVLAEHAHNDGTEARPCVDTISRETRMSRRSVQAALRKLEADGMIEKTGTWQKGESVWRVIMGGAESAPGGEAAAGGGRSSRPGGGEDTSPKPSTEPSLEPSVESAGAREPDQVEVVWAHWQEVFDSPRSVLDSTRRRIIEEALKIRPAADCCLAIDGLAKSDFNVKGGYTDIRYALRGGGRSPSPEATIQRMIAFANGEVRLSTGRSDELPSGHRKGSAEWNAHADAYIAQQEERQELTNELVRLRTAAGTRPDMAELSEIFEWTVTRLREEVAKCR